MHCREMLSCIVLWIGFIEILFRVHVRVVSTWAELEHRVHSVPVESRSVRYLNGDLKSWLYGLLV